YSGSESIDNELTCILCTHIMNEAYATACGHSFCYECLNEHVKYEKDCPSCHTTLSTTQIYPNFQLNRLAEIKKQVKGEHLPTFKTQNDRLDELVTSINSDRASIISSLAHTLSYSDIQKLLEITLEAKKSIEQHEDIEIKFDLLDVFLAKLKSRNDMDMNTNRDTDQQNSEDQSTEGADWNTMSFARSEHHNVDIHALNTSSLSARVDKRFGDLKDLYYTQLSPNAVADMNEDERLTKLESFSSTLYEMTRYGSLDLKDTIHYADTSNVTSIVSSIEFDRDDEFFAVGGILKDIKIFDFKLTNQGPGINKSSMHCPLLRIGCDHKISCLSWSSYIKSQITSSDYQGVINVWDITTGRKMLSFGEHRRRAWSVDTSLTNPNLLASGSDDTTVKVWSVNSPNSLFTLQHKGNICCAKFSPNNSNYLAVGSADHDMFCYDLRFPATPLHVYQGHQKAVSYVRWMNGNELISASTDNSLKIWNRESTECLRTFKGHLNEKNFVGLSVIDDWIACGSETNTVHTYHKYSRTPVAQYKFPLKDLAGKPGVENDPTFFVSSVCWKKDRSKLLAANSKGIIRVLQLK
ncbi:coatomer subunit alpha, partial [Rhizopus stolonifer]